MGKKKKHPEHENLERWLVSYADFITLLFATFTALYAIAQAELSEMGAVGDAIRMAFRQQSLLGGIESLLQGSGADSGQQSVFTDSSGQGDGILGQFDDIVASEAAQQEQVKADLLAVIEAVNEQIEALNEDLAEHMADGEAGPDADGYAAEELEGLPLRGVTLSQQERGMKISVDSRLLFRPGSAELMPASRALLDTIASRLKGYARTHLIKVEGHTDSQAISTARFPSNWELSTGRSSVVVRRLIGKGLPPSQLVAVGYGDTRPVAENTTAVGRAKNRRIDIVLYNRDASDLTDPLGQQAEEITLLDDNETGTLQQRAQAVQARRAEEARVLKNRLLRVEEAG